MGDLDRVPVVLVTRNCGYQRAKRSGDKGANSRSRIACAPVARCAAAASLRSVGITYTICTLVKLGSWLAPGR